MTKIIPIALLGLLFTACKKENNNPAGPDPIPVEDVQEIAAINQSLGWKIFNKEHAAKPDENILISPWSIQTAVQMAINGAKGNTLDEILELMDCKDCEVASLNQFHGDLTTMLTQQSGQPTLTMANGYFYDPNRINLKTPFVNTLTDDYACGFKNLDFTAEETSLDQINTWVKNSTNGKIDKILEKITDMDVAFLINALHFKADWATGFAPESTYETDFTKADGSKVPVELVNADRNFTFRQGNDYNLVDIPFKDSTYSLTFIQPAKNNTDPDWHSKLDQAKWLALYNDATYQRAIVAFPKLKLAYENDLIASLKALGVVDAFSDRNADFTDMGTSSNNIFINQIKHKAVLNVDEKGAEGAAVTSIGFGVTSLPPTFYFTSPFILVLRHIPTNTMIFTGYVADPEI